MGERWGEGALGLYLTKQIDRDDKGILEGLSRWKLLGLAPCAARVHIRKFKWHIYVHLLLISCRTFASLSNSHEIISLPWAIKHQ